MMGMRLFSALGVLLTGTSALDDFVISLNDDATMAARWPSAVEIEGDPALHAVLGRYSLQGLAAHPHYRQDAPIAGGDGELHFLYHSLNRGLWVVASSEEKMARNRGYVPPHTHTA